MLHEVLVYLWSCPSEVFTENSIEEWIDRKELNEFIHPSERSLLSKILRIAVQYHEIMHFYNKTFNLETISYENASAAGDSQIVALPSEVRPGIYVKAFCFGLDKVLASYRSDIILLEEKILNNPQMVLLDVLSVLSKYVTLFGALRSIISAIQRKQVHGCRLVEQFDVYTKCGIPNIVESMCIVTQHINPIFYRDLCNWIIYGSLNDVYNEFFIKDAKCPDENFMYPEQITENSNSLSISICLSKKQKIKRPAIVQKFVIDESLLPAMIPLEIAEKILFMGRIVWIFRNRPKQQSNEECNSSKDIWEDKDFEYYQKIQSMDQKPFDVEEFTKVIEMCRVKLTKYLWTVMVDNAKLLEHLQLIRDYYGLGKGELFQQFLKSAEDHFKENPSLENINNQLNFLFRDTSRKIYGDNDKTYKRFKFHMQKTEQKTVLKPWILPELHFNISWPLHIIFHPHAMNLYNKLFSFLLRVKKTHIDLHSLWWKHTSSKTKINNKMWSLLHNLMFIINNLQYYLQVDVIEAQFSILIESVRNANEFEDITRLHSVFLSKLLSQSFVMSADLEVTKTERQNLYQVPTVTDSTQNIVYKVINALLELCDEFCLKANVWDIELLDLQLQDLDDYREKTDALIQCLLELLYSVHKQASGQHLMQLLNRLDFNCFYSKSKAKMNV